MRNSIALCCAVALVLLLAPLAATADEKKDLAADEITLRGIVVDDGGSPVEGANVSIEWYQGRADVRTDDAGEYEIRLPRRTAPGQWVSAEATVGDALKLAGRQLAYELDDVVELESLELKPPRKVELHVVNKSGEPIAGAQAGLLREFGRLAQATTDEAGAAVFHIAQDAVVGFAYALHSGDGFDYRSYVLTHSQRSDQRAVAPEVPTEPIVLSLDGASPLTVRVVDDQGEPIPEVSVYPWVLKKPDQDEQINLSAFAESFSTRTNEEGIAILDWIPYWQEQAITVWPSSTKYDHQRSTYEPRTGDGTLTLELARLVPIRGKVTLHDGSPAAGISITATGEGRQLDGFRQFATTDEDGNYEIMAAPNMIYLVIAQSKEWASEPRTGFALWPDEPIDDLDFVLRPATRVFGRVTVGENRAPVKDQHISFTQRGQHLPRPEDVELSNSENGWLWSRPRLWRHTKTDEDGRFELYAGPGEFGLSGPQQAESHQFEITDETELEFNFHSERPETEILRGTVVAGDPPQPVAGAIVTGIYRHPIASRDLEARTDSSGAFEVEREFHRTVLHARNEDRSLAGVVEIEADDDSVVIPIAPTASASGRLIEDETSVPMANERIMYGVGIRTNQDGIGSFRISFGGVTTTNEEGKFSLEGLIVEQQYDLSVLVVHSVGEQNILTMMQVGSVVPKSSEEIELGDLRYKRPEPPPTAEERVARTFAAPKPPIERLESAMTDAGIGRQHVLLLLAPAVDPQAKAIIAKRFEDSGLYEAMQPYQLVVVDTAEENFAAAEPVIERLGLDFREQNASATLVLVDTDGEVLVQVSISSLFTEDQFDKDQFVALLDEHALPPLDAHELLADALAEAVASDKRVIVQETATWCGPCWLLSRYFHKHRDKWQDDYILVKMDHRWTGAREIMKEFRDGASGGIPWWAILDGEGNVLVTSNTPEGNNIGFPSSDEGKAHYRTMIETTAPRLNEEEITALVEAVGT